LSARARALFGIAVPQQRHAASSLVGRLTHPIASQASQVRLYAMKGPLARGGASLHARLALRFAPWKTIERLEKPCSSE
jgi:hypothetical protein